MRQRCDETGTLLILDEIQTGFGRTGYMFAHQKYSIILIFGYAKGMGGGMPIGAL
ncbi:MAG: aminotransferase class III-fold pyridoxal phosphate-dependent enzyme [Saprospiraceae bacterium]|nr:aminotransferase class III-fold pyridoxal phosphate-dependent enzyme [Saprospiraceae bacterium]